MTENKFGEIFKHLNDIKRFWNEFLNKFKQDVKSSFDLTNLKLNFLNIYIKSIFGGEKSELLGLIGDIEKVETHKILNMQVCVYEKDNEIALITALCWLGGVNSSIPTISDIDILTYIMFLTDVIDLKIGYVCYKKEDSEENTFKKFGFVETDLETTEDCYILLKTPNTIKF